MGETRILYGSEEYSMAYNVVSKNRTLLASLFTLPSWPCSNLILHPTALTPKPLQSLCTLHKRNWELHWIWLPPVGIFSASWPGSFWNYCIPGLYQCFPLTSLLIYASRTVVTLNIEWMLLLWVPIHPSLTKGTKVCVMTQMVPHGLGC